MGMGLNQPKIKTMIAKAFILFLTQTFIFCLITLYICGDVIMSHDMQCKPKHLRQRIPPKWMQKILVHRKQRHSYLAISPCCSHMMMSEGSRDTGWWLLERDVRISTYEYYFCIGLIQMYWAVVSILSIWRYSKVYHQSKKKSKCRQWQIFSTAEF